MMNGLSTKTVIDKIRNLLQGSTLQLSRYSIGLQQRERDVTFRQASIASRNPYG